MAHARKAVFYLRSDTDGATRQLWMVDLSSSPPALPAQLLDVGPGILNYAVSDDSAVGRDCAAGSVPK